MSVENTARQGYGVTPAISVELNWTRCLLPPFEHQKEGVRALIRNQVFALFDEMGAGKTKQVVDAACFMADANAIDTVLVVTPASVRAVWAGEFGEIDKHAFVASSITEFHSSKSMRLPFKQGTLNWHVTNYEFIRDKEKLDALMTQLVNRKLLIVLDESSRIKTHNSATTKAVLKLAKFFPRSRRVILNGTPISNDPADLWSQMEFLSPRIIGCEDYWHYQATYAILKKMDGFRKVVGWRKLEEVQMAIKPHCLRRLKIDCLDLPNKSYTVREAKLGKSWKLYMQMRDDCIAFLGQYPNMESSAAPQAVVRLLRLSQLTAGFLGGITEQPTAELLALSELGVMPVNLVEPREVGREKVDAFLEMVKDMLAADPSLRLLVWTRFRAELDRVATETFKLGVTVGRIEGEQSEKERRATVAAFQDLTDPRPMVLFGNPQAGGLGLTLHASHRVVYLSNDYNLITRLQSEDRVHRPGQRHPVTYTDVIATGPEGQRTIDHVILNALQKKQNLAAWTTDVWRRELSE